MKTHNDDPDVNDAVSIAEFLPEKVPFTFTAGTGNRYYSFPNDRLLSDQYYGVFILGVIFVNGKVSTRNLYYIVLHYNNGGVDI